MTANILAIEVIPLYNGQFYFISLANRDCNTASVFRTSESFSCAKYIQCFSVVVRTSENFWFYEVLIVLLGFVLLTFFQTAFCELVQNKGFLAEFEIFQSFFFQNVAKLLRRTGWTRWSIIVVVRARKFKKLKFIRSIILLGGCVFCWRFFVHFATSPKIENCERNLNFFQNAPKLRGSTKGTVRAIRGAMRVCKSKTFGFSVPQSVYLDFLVTFWQSSNFCPKTQQSCVGLQERPYLS